MTLTERLRFELSRIADDVGSHQLMFLRQSEARELRDALEAKDARIKELEGALLAMIERFDAPIGSQVLPASEIINRARAALEGK